MNQKHSTAQYSELPTASVLLNVNAKGGAFHDGDDEDHDNDVPKAVPISTFDVESSFTDSGIHKGVVQEPAFRDKWFGVAFLVHLGIMMSLFVMYATGYLESSLLDGTDSNVVNADGSTNDTGGRRHLLALARLLNNTETNEAAAAAIGRNPTLMDDPDAVKGLAGVVLSMISPLCLALWAMIYMKDHATLLIQASLGLAVAVNVLLGFAMASVVNLILAALFACYAKAVWHRIPFAASNLKAAVTCVHSNLGMVFFGLLSIPLYTLWFVLWVYVLASVLTSPWMKTQETDFQVTDDVMGFSNTHEEEQVSSMGSLAIAALSLSFYWTWHVLRNVAHTTFAGTVGTWWFLPQEASSCCSRGLTDSLSRSLTYSFGSICLGSLLVALIEVVKGMVHSAARHGRNGILRCIAECLLSIIEAIALYFNKWAFIYVGLYGYSYVEAGKNVIGLFRQRGWSNIISDALVNRMLGMMCFCIGLSNFGLVFVFTVGMPEDTVMILCWASFLVGLLLSSVTFGVLASAVDTIMVLYAEAPAEFKDNHPELCHELEESWSKAWPDVFASPASWSSGTTTTTHTTTTVHASRATRSMV